MNHINKIIDADPHFTIDPISRRIRNESSKKVTLIQGDHNSERFSFELPRFVEGHDMLECNRVEVHFINIENGTGNRHEDMFDVKDMQILPDNPEHVAFSWLITDNATKYVGSLAFGIRFCCTDTDNVADYVWKTAVNKDIKISEGMNTAESVDEAIPDIIAQWEERIFGDVGDAVENINTAKTDALKEINDVLGKGKETFATKEELANASFVVAEAYTAQKAYNDFNGDLIEVSKLATKEELNTKLGEWFADYVEKNFATNDTLKNHAENNLTHIAKHEFTDPQIYRFREASALDDMLQDGIHILIHDHATGILFCGHGYNMDEANTQILLDIDGNLYSRTRFAVYSEDGSTYTMKWTAWDSYTTKKYVDSLIGDIETSLENIIAKYGLGGDSV